MIMMDGRFALRSELVVLAIQRCMHGLHPLPIHPLLLHLLALALLLFYVAYLGATALYNIFLSPLSALPGPWYAAASDLWLLLHAARFMQCGTIHDLLQRYGPIVRVGPRRVVFRDHAAMKSVYCINKLPKSAFYKALIAMTSLTNMEHTRRRKTFASHHALSYVSLFQPHINSCVIRLVEILDVAPRTSADCIHLLRHLLVDILRMTLFGLAPVALNRWALGDEDLISAAVRDFPLRAILNLLVHLPHKRWREIYQSDSILASFVRGRLQEVQHVAQSDLDIKSASEPVPMMHRLLSQRSGLSFDVFLDQEIILECISHLVAGVDTSTATFGFMLWELSRRPDIVHRLRMELDDIMPDRRTVPPYTALMKQLYLSAFLTKGASGALRYPLDLMGYSLPPGTIVGTQAFSIHRDPDIYLSPEVFDPGMVTIQCYRRGGREASQASLVLNFDIEANPLETNERTMAVRDAFAVRPASRECKLTLVPRP
ncbi:cytochrome P450 [Trametes punicea]|nr:cytochrome P450 [Trametes punicea]